MNLPVQLRWSDFDPNYHLRHSVYYDFGAMARVAMLSTAGLSPQIFQQHKFGPILFKEECVFRKEVHMNDQLEISTSLLACRPTGSRFTIKHQIIKNTDVLCAELTVWGDWIDMTTRKLWQPAPFLAEMMELMPKDAAFQYL